MLPRTCKISVGGSPVILHFGTPILVWLVELIVLFTNLEPYWKKMRFILLQDSLVIWLHIVLLGQDIWSS